MAVRCDQSRCVEASGPSFAPMMAPMTTAPRRLVFLDALRLLAIFQMVQGHTLDAVLDTAARTGALHGAWTALRGLTSVAFLFIAGFATSLAILNDYPRQRSDPRKVRARVKRAAGLVALGYLLHLPVGALVGGQFRLAVAEGACVDILHCIGVTLMLLELGVRCCRTPAALLAVAGFAAAVTLGTASLAWELSARLPVAAAGYAGPVHGALFPLWPWAGHLWLGVLAGGLLRPAAPGLGLRLACSAAGLGALGWAGALLAGGAPAGEHLQRLAWVVAAAAVLHGAVGWPARLPEPVQRISTSSLRIYVAHVLLVYADGVGLASWLGPTLALPWALGVTGLVVLGSAAIALLPPLPRPVVARVPRTG